jgi:signal peptide peptidase SppA
MRSEAPSIDIDLRPIAGLSLDLDQYFGLWAVEDSRFLGLLSHIQALDLVQHIECRTSAAEVSQARVRQEQAAEARIAVIQIDGTMTKRGSSLSTAGATVAIRKAVRAAARDEAIGGILLQIDSPGGTVAGTADLANEVYRANQQKPVWGFAEDLTASAAYWVASQAGRVVANDRTAMIGSIGTYAALYDYSGLAGREGIRAVVIRAGRFKGAGFPGSRITEEQEAYWQELIDKTQAEFSEAIARGRGLSLEKVKEELADGRVHMAADAQALGLIDGIQTFEETLGQLRGQLKQTGNSKPRNTRSMMTQQSNSEGGNVQLPPVQPLPSSAASFEELVSALPGADEKFIFAQQKAKATVEQARQAWMTEQAARIEAAQKRAEEAEQAAAAAKKKPGVKPLGGAGEGSSYDGDPVAEWNAAIKEKIAGGMSRQRAASAVNRENPGLRESYVAAYNAEHAGRPINK